MLFRSYTDNGSHFVGKKVDEMFAHHGVAKFTAPITHPSSVGLLERYVRMMIGQLRTRCVAAGSLDGWSLYVKDSLLSINTRMIRVHGFSPAELLLGFNPRISRATASADSSV